MTLARRLALRRAWLGLDLKRIAFECSVAITTVSAWENEKRWPSAPHLFAWCNALGCRIQLVIEGEESEPDGIDPSQDDVLSLHDELLGGTTAAHTSRQV